MSLRGRARPEHLRRKHTLGSTSGRGRHVPYRLLFAQCLGSQAQHAYVLATDERRTGACEHAGLCRSATPGVHRPHVQHGRLVTSHSCLLCLNCRYSLPRNRRACRLLAVRLVDGGHLPRDALTVSRRQRLSDLSGAQRGDCAEPGASALPDISPRFPLAFVVRRVIDAASTPLRVAQVHGRPGNGSGDVR